MKCVFVICIVSQMWMGTLLVRAEKLPDNNFTFTYTMAMRCKEHLSQSGYSYDTFYRVDANERKPSEGVAFEMHIGILAASNGHILLSTVPHPEANDPVYEIVVGGGGNKFTELRRNLRRNAKTSAKTMGILSPIEFRAFYVKISEDGVIEFGREGDKLPLLSYTDVNPIFIKYFSFASWSGVEAKFLYDCPAPGENMTAPDSKEVEPKLSSSDLVKRTLLQDRDPTLPPSPTMNILMGLKVISVNYDAFDSKLTTGLAILTSWNDDSLSWDPNKFNGTTSIKFRQGVIWRPTFFVFNSDDMGVVDTKNPELISVVHSGEATFHFQTKITTWCSLKNIERFSKWPRDEYTCNIIIGPWEAHEEIYLKEMKPTDKKIKEFAAIDDVIRNEWEIVVRKVVVSAEMWKSVFVSGDNETYQSDRIVLTLGLKRQATSYKIVFYSPLLVLMTFVLLSFWSEPLQMSRVGFYASCVIAICMGLCYIDYLVPCHSVPSILVLYTTVLSAVLLAMIVHIILMTSPVDKLCKTVRMQNMLASRWFRILFCLPAMKTCGNYESVNEAYDVQEDDDSGVIIAPRNGNVEEMQRDSIKHSEKAELAESIDKLMFVIFSMVFAVMLTMHY